MGGVNRRILTLVVALVPILAFGLLLSVVTVPFVALGPGPTFDTLGEVNGKQVVDIKSTDGVAGDITHPTSGHLNMTTVSQRDGLTLGQALVLWMSGRDQLVPRELVYPPDKSKDDIDKSNTADFKRSEDDAEFAALSYLKYPKAVTVESVDEKGPSAGKLERGDAIDMVNNIEVPDLKAFQDIVKATRPGEQIVIDYRRKNGPMGTTTITLGEHPEGEQGYLGVGVLDAPWAPFEIEFNLANIGGPSAGLMFSLAVDRQADHRGTQRRQVRRRHRHHRRRRQGRLHRRYHPQDGGRPRCRGDGVHGARRQLLRGTHRARGRPAVGEGGHADHRRGRAERDLRRRRTPDMLRDSLAGTA